MSYLAFEPAGGIVHCAVCRRGGVRRGSGVSHVTAPADADAASTAATAAVSATDPNNIVIAPVHPCEEDASSLSLERAILQDDSHGPLPRALPPIRDPRNILFPRTPTFS